jgi:hypothetical protein
MYKLVVASSQDVLAQDLEDFGTAREAAEQEATQRTAEITVIQQETGAVAFVTSPKAIAKQETGEYFTPWTRVETPKFIAPDFPGYVAAYTRKRISATVYRKVDDKGWRVHDGRTGNFRDVENTKKACALTSEMRQGLEL